MNIASYILSSDFQRSYDSKKRSVPWKLNQRTILIGLLAFITIGFSMGFGVRTAGDVGLNYQNGAKLIIWACLLFWGMIEWKSVVPLLLQPAGYLLSFLGLYAAFRQYGQRFPFTPQRQHWAGCPMLF